MTWDFCRETTPKARKEYTCDAIDWILNDGLDSYEFSDEELSIIKNAESEKWKILKGTEYVKCEGKWEGDFSVFRARKDINQICIDHDIYSH
jgi:hypothetical protein